MFCRLVFLCRLVVVVVVREGCYGGGRANEEDKVKSGDNAGALGNDKVESGEPDPIDPRAARAVASE